MTQIDSQPRAEPVQTGQPVPVSAQRAASPSPSNMSVMLLWIVSLVVTAVISYSIGKSVNTSPPQIVQQAVFGTTTQPTEVPALPTVDINKTCKKSGLAQKWEYLTEYTAKQNDTLSNIATTQLGNAGRVNEIMKLNSDNPFVEGSTLYLPPASVTQSSGNLKQVYGTLVERDEGNWHLSFGGGLKGNGILIPTYWFADIADKDSFQVGDCLTVLFDDGFKVFSVSKQK